MAKATKTTEQVQKVTYEDKDTITVEMSPDEATAVYSVLWLMETERANDHYVAMKDVQNALGIALDFPVTKFRFSNTSCFNDETSVYIYPRD